MIRFNGELSDKCKRDVQKNMSKVATISALVPVTVFSVIIVILIFTRHWTYVIALPALTLPVVLAAIPTVNAPLKALNPILPKTITIDDDEVFLESQSGFQSSPIQKVKKVVDFGDWYQLIFYIGYRGCFFCQKSLIVQGTIEEFEALFGDKIVCKPL